MRVLYLNPCGQVGGAETSLLELLASVRAAEPDWVLWLVLGEDGPLAQRAERLGVHVIVVPFPRALARLGDSAGRSVAAIWGLFRAATATAFYVRKLAATVEAINPELIHTNGFKMHLLGACVRPRSSPIIWHIHDYVSGRPLMSRLLRYYQGDCAMAIANSLSVAADVRRALSGLRVVPIYNAVDFDQFSPAGKELDLDAMCGLPPSGSEVVRVGLVGTFARWKGHKTFLRALAQLPADPPVRGYVIGGPIYQSRGSQFSLRELQDEATRLQLDGRLGFTGFVENPAEAMRSLDIVVHASTEPEPFGMVVVEGMACAKPVIVSNAGGAAELFEEGHTAVGHSPGDAADLARQIERLARDASLRARLGYNGRATAERIFDRTRLARELTHAYQGCHNHPGVETAPVAY